MTQKLITITAGALMLAGTGCGSSLFHPRAKDAKPVADKDKTDTRKINDAPPARINPMTHFAAGQVHEREGHLLAAADQYRRATQADPKYVMAFNRLGIVCDKLKMYAEADQAFETAITLAPDASFLRNNFAYSRMLQGDYAKAESSLREALRINQSYSRARINLGVVLARSGRIPESAESFAMVLPKDVAYYNVAVLCVADGRYDDARSAFEQVVALNPDAADARRQLGKLRQFKDTPSDALKAELTATAERIVGNFGPAAQAPTAATPAPKPSASSQPGVAELDFEP